MNIREQSVVAEKKAKEAAIQENIPPSKYTAYIAEKYLHFLHEESNMSSEPIEPPKKEKQTKKKGKAKGGTVSPSVECSEQPVSKKTEKTNSVCIQPSKNEWGHKVGSSASFIDVALVNGIVKPSAILLYLVEEFDCITTRGRISSHISHMRKKYFSEPSLLLSLHLQPTKKPITQ